MTSKDSIKKELGSLITKRVISALIGTLSTARSQSHRASAEDPEVIDVTPSWKDSTAWKEVEQKLQGLFGHEESNSALPSRLPVPLAGAAAVVAFLAVVYFAGYRRGKSRSTVLEVHKA